jgi:hypothetical protein
MFKRPRAFYTLTLIRHCMLMCESDACEVKETFHCLRCGYSWPQRIPGIVPKNCANRACKSPNWQKPRSERKKYTWQSEETKARASHKVRYGLEN